MLNPVSVKLVFIFALTLTTIQCTEPISEEISENTPDFIDTLCTCDELILNVETNRVFHSESENPFSGACELYYSNGVKSTNREYVDGQIHGVVTEWYESGQKMTEKQFEHNHQNGYYRHWREDGRLKYEALYTSGVLDTILLNDKTLNPDDIYVK